MLLRAEEYARWTTIAGLVVLATSADRATAQCLEGCTAIHTIVGEADGDQFGWEARVLGDVDGDGFDDFISSSPTNDAAGNDTGRIYVYSGATGAELYHMSGSIANAQFGFAMNAAGDINGDNVPDFIVGTPGTNRGRITVHSGVDGSVLRQILGEAAGDQFGYRVDGRGDLDGDGVNDHLIGARNRDANGVDSGRAYVYSGVDGTLLCTVDGEDTLDNLGTGVAFVGDLDGDGRDEFVVDAENAGPAGTGRAYLYSFDGVTCTRLRTFSPPNPAFAFAFGALFVGGRLDVDGDGTPDIYLTDFNVNRAYIYSGATYQTLMTLIGDNNGGFGIGEIMPDIDNDGHADIILAAWISNIGGNQAGKIFIYSGRTGAVLETLTHDIAGATFGFDAAGIGDLNGDGKKDYLITAAWDLNQKGVTYVIAGKVAPYLTGDLDFSDCVDLTDLSLMLSGYGCIGPACTGDINHSGATDLEDVSLLLANFGACRS